MTCTVRLFGMPFLVLILGMPPRVVYGTVCKQLPSKLSSIYVNQAYHDGLMVGCRLGAFDSLPTELWETIIGYLDVRNLCMARLVCTLFCNAASRFLHSVQISGDDLRSAAPITFPKLSQVRLSCGYGDDFSVIAQPPFRDAVTHLGVVGSLSQMVALRPTANAAHPGVFDCDHLGSSRRWAGSQGSVASNPKGPSFAWAC